MKIVVLPLTLLLLSCNRGPEPKKLWFQVTPDGNLTWNDWNSKPVLVKDLKAVPEEFPKDLIYPGARVLHGGMSKPGGVITAVFETSDPTEKAAKWYTEAMRKKGRDFLTQYGEGSDISLGFGDIRRSSLRGMGLIRFAKTDAGTTIFQFMVDQEKRE